MPALAQPHYLVPDSAAHVAWVRSLVWDRDIDFANDYARLGMIEREGAIAFGAPAAGGRAGNPFGLGSAVVWAAPVALAGVLARIAAAAGSAVATDGFGTATLFAVHCGTWAAAIAAALATAAAVARWLPQVGGRARALGVAAAFLGTSLPYYVLQLPSYSHVPSVLPAALALLLAARARSAPPGRWGWVGLGALAGLAALIRPQDAALAWLPLVLAGWRPRASQAARTAASYAAGFVAVACFQTLAWAHLYGPTGVPPQGAGFLGLRAEGLWGVLVSTRHGWLVWSPVVVLALAGWIRIARSPATRVVGIAALAGAGLEWLANAAALDWWAGWSFGARRFTTLVPLLALGLAAAAGCGRAWRVAVAGATVLGLVQWVRVATRALPGDADPGWNALWGRGFLEFLPQLPGAVLELVATPWTDLQVLRHASAPGPSLTTDPAGFVALVFVVWCALLAVSAGWWRRRRA